jgi:hypothetical protein
MDFKYGTAKSTRADGDSLYGDPTSSLAPQGGLYGSGRFGYTINDQTLTGLSVATSSAATSASIAFSGSPAGLAEYTVPLSSFTNPDVAGVRAFVPSGSITGVLPEFTRVEGGNVIFVANTGGAIAGVAYHRQPTDTTRGDFEDRIGAGGG